MANKFNAPTHTYIGTHHTETAAFHLGLSDDDDHPHADLIGITILMATPSFPDVLVHTDTQAGIPDGALYRRPNYPEIWEFRYGGAAVSLDTTEFDHLVDNLLPMSADDIEDDVAREWAKTMERPGTKPSDVWYNALKSLLVHIEEYDF